MTPNSNPAKDFLLYPADEVHLQKLGPVQRDLLEMATNDGARCADIATTRQLPIGTVKSRIHRARERILVLRAEAKKEKTDAA